MNKKHVLLPVAMIGLLMHFTYAQTKIIVTEIPKNTPTQNPIYLTGPFNKWNPSDPNFKLQLNSEGLFEITVNDRLLPIEFKFCRGQSEMMEGSKKGQPIPLRTLSGKEKTELLTIVSWMDLEYYELIVNKLPDNTPPDQPLYVAGNFNNWQAGDPRYKLHVNQQGAQFVRIPAQWDSLEYKYNRGTWITVEGDILGKVRSNRYYFKNGEGPILIYDEIQSWEDLATGDTYSFIITEVPENTPYDASLYLVGNFNDWTPGNPDYKFTKLPDGSYSYTLFKVPNDLEYKITRGTWNTVEGGIDGKAIKNRVYHRKKSGPVVLYLEIKTWEDISGSRITYDDMFLAISAVIAFLLIVAFNWMENGHEQANRYITLSMVIMIIAFGFRVLTKYRDFFNWLPKLVLVPDIIYFTIPPLMLFYFQSLLEVRPRISISRWFSFIPAGIMFLVYLPFIVLENDVFISRIVNREFHHVFEIVAVVGLMFCAFYWRECLKVLKTYTLNMDNTVSFDQSHYFLNSLLTLHFSAMFTWLAAIIIGVGGFIFGKDTVPVTDSVIDISWVLFSFTPILVAYFAISQPELFRTEEITEKYKYSNLTDEAANKLKSQLNLLMVSEKPFLDPKLTLHQLAEMLETNTNSLSRVINEGFNKNFYDYINFYRVEEFKKLVNQDDHKQYTFLSVAYKVGFSSKTTFNRAFKKLEGITPREFYKKLLETSDQKVRWV